MLPADAARLVDRYLAVADRLLPGRITHFHVVGSAALGAWRPGVSDVDFVAALDGAPSGPEVRRLRLLHPAGNVTAVARAVRRLRPAVPGTVNGVFVAAGELSQPVTEIKPLASHTGASFRRGQGFDVNPVMWKVLAERGIAVRGPAPRTLDLNPEPERLRAWNLENLRGYWRGWAASAAAGKVPGAPLPARWAGPGALAWGVLGPVRLHRTIATGEVVSKEAAGAYALEVFSGRWHPLIRTALACRRGERPRPAVDAALIRRAGEFVREVIEDAAQWCGAGPSAPPGR